MNRWLIALIRAHVDQLTDVVLLSESAAEASGVGAVAKGLMQQKTCTEQNADDFMSETLYLVV